MIDLVIKSYKPSLKDNSLKIYLTSLRVLNDGNDIKNIEFLKDYDKIIEKLSKKKDNTKKNYLNAIIIALKALKSDEKLIKRYEELRDKYQKQYQDLTASHTKTSTQEKNWVDWEEYLKMVDELGDLVKDLKSKKEWDNEDLVNNQNYLVPLLYKHYAIRNDWHDMEVLKQREFKKRDDKENFLVVGTSSKSTKYKFVLNNFKTSAKYKQISIPVESKELQRAIDLFLKYNKSGYFIISPKRPDEPISGNELTKLLIGLSVKHLDGRRVGSSLIRHIYLSHKYGDTLKESEKDAQIMGHSTDQQKHYVKTG